MLLWLLACDPPTPPAAPTHAATVAATASAEAPAIPRLPRQPFASARLFILDLWPQPPPDLHRPASTYGLQGNALPPGGVREAREGFEVFTTCDERGCADGLRQGGRVLMEPMREEGIHHQDRVLRIAAATPDTISALILESQYTNGAAHSNNRVECAAWSRAEHVRLTLFGVLGEAEARRRLSWITDARHTASGDDSLYYGLGLWEMTDATWPQGDTDQLLLDGGDPILCLPEIVGAGGESWLFRLSAPATPERAGDARNDANAAPEHDQAPRSGTAGG